MRVRKKSSRTRGKPLKARGRNRLKKKDKLRQSLEKIRQEREAVLSDDDAEFVREGLASGRIHFLENIGLQEKGNREKISKRRATNALQEEEDYELQPRAAKWSKEGDDYSGQVRYLLPLKSSKGLIYQDPIPVEEEGQEAAEDEEALSDFETKSEGDSADPSPVHPHMLSVAELLAQREKKLSLRKQTIASLSYRLLEDPESNVTLLKKLRAICLEDDPQVAVTVRKLSMVSLMTVLKDLVPSYKIRELTNAEKAVKVSKDVRKVRDYEQQLVSNYRHYLTLLDDTLRAGLLEERVSAGKKRKTASKAVLTLAGDHSLSRSQQESLAEVALHCLCELGVALPHFNCFADIVGVLVPRMASSSLEGKVSALCCDAISRIFKNDVVGEVSLETVQEITKLIKAKNYRVDPKVLQTFLHLHLHNVEGPVSQAGSRAMAKSSSKAEKQKRQMEVMKMSKKQRKKLKSRIKLEKELKETEAVESKEKKNKLQTEITKLVFLNYFHVLKRSRQSPVLPAVLEGLAKFAHLISVDYFADLMSVLDSLLEHNSLSPRESMQCIVTAFEILSGQGEALNIDPRQFYCKLYTNLLQLDYLSSSHDVLLALNCLRKLLERRRQVSMLRVLAFVKRLCTVSLHLPPGFALAVLATVRQFMQSYHQHCQQLLDESSGCGLFQPEVSDPELSGAQATLLWELSLLQRHVDPHVCSYAQHLLAGAPSQGPNALHPNYSRRETVDLIQGHSWPRLDAFAGIPPNPATGTKPATASTDLWVSSNFFEYLRASQLTAEGVASTWDEAEFSIQPRQ